MSKWLTLGPEPGGKDRDFHVIPVDDLKEHVDSRECPCGPRVEDDHVVVHHSYDQREYMEQAVERGGLPRSSKLEIEEGIGLLSLRDRDYPYRPGLINTV